MPKKLKQLSKFLLSNPAPYSAKSLKSKDRNDGKGEQKKKKKELVHSAVHIWGKGIRTKTPYALHQPLLLLGEGNFSFSVSLVKQMLEQSSLNPDEDCTPSFAKIFPTCFDSEEILYEKYGTEARENVAYLQKAGCKVLFSIDATRIHLHKELKGNKFHRIVFHFPHVGLGIKDKAINIRENQKLIHKFLQSSHALLLTNGAARKQAAEYKTSMIPKDLASKTALFAAPPFLDLKGLMNNAIDDNDDNDDAADKAEIEPVPEVHVTIKMKDPYTLWDVKKMGSPLLQFRESFKFDPDVFPGYEHRRTIGFQEGISVGSNSEIKGCDCKTFVFLPSHTP